MSLMRCTLKEFKEFSELSERGLDYLDVVRDLATRNEVTALTARDFAALGPPLELRVGRFSFTSLLLARGALHLALMNECKKQG